LSGNGKEKIKTKKGKKAIETDPQMGTNTGVVTQGFKITMTKLFRK